MAERKRITMIDRKILIRRLSLAAYFVLAFFVFLFFLFPFDRVKSRIESEVRLRTPLELSIARVSPRFFNRFALADMVVSDKSGRVLFESPSAHATVSLFGLLRGILSVDLRADAYGGEVVLRALQGRDQLSFLFDANGLDLASYPLLKELGFHASGKIGGNFEMIGESGKGRLWVKGLATRQLKVQGFPVPDFDFEQGWLEGELKGDRLSIKKMELDGKELKVRMSGDMVLNQQGMLNLMVKLKPSERLAHEQSGIISLLKNRDADGFYQVGIGGTVAAPLPRL
jgi:type II secretion system protein N